MKIRITNKTGFTRLFPLDVYTVIKEVDDCYHLLDCAYIIHKDRCEIIEDYDHGIDTNAFRTPECPCGINRKDCEYHK